MLRRVRMEEFGLFDQLIANAPQPHFAQTTGWARFKSVTWRPLHYIFEPGGQPAIAVTVWLRKAPLVPYSLAYAPRGPVLLTEGACEHLAAFFSALKQELFREGAFALKIDPPWSEGAEQLQSLGFNAVKTDHPFGGTQPRLTFRRDISADEEELMASLNKKIRYNVRYPEKNGVEYYIGGKGDIPLLMQVLKDTSRRKRFLGREADYYERLFDIMGDNVSLIVGKHEGKVVAAGVTMICGPLAWAIYGGMMREHAQLRAYYGLNWRRILWAKDQGATCFDFFGVPVDHSPESPLHGLYQFKKSFGGDLVEFIGEYELPVRPAVYSLWNVVSPVALKGRRAVLRAMRRDSGGSSKGE